MHSQVRGLFALLLIAGTAHVAVAQTNVPVSPNSQKYSNNGAKPATGRAGSASLQTRAMLAKNATMLVEASTGDVEVGPGPGTIAKAQLKIGGSTQNFNGLTGGGYWSTTVPGVARGTSVQVQTNVRGIDPKRTDVVTVVGPALLRPDITVRSVSGPAEARPKSPVHFYATVAELNEDIGAHTNCVLAIDDVVVDSADAIWVDAADVVTCEFTYTFAKPGKYAVKVSATDVTPGDWDGANNSAATSITIVNPDRKINNGYMGASVYRYLYEHGSGRSGCVDFNGNSCNYDSMWGSSYISASVHVGGWTQGLSAPVERLDVQAYADGIIQHNVSLTPIFFSDYTDPNNDYTSSCRSYFYQFRRQDGTWVQSGDRFSMCTYGFKSTPQWGGTSYWYLRLEGKASYYSSSQSGGWSYNHTYWTYGNGEDLGWKDGTVVRLKLAYVDQSGVNHTLDRSLTLQGQTPVDVNDRYSSTDQWGTYYRYYLRHNSWASAWNWFNDPQ